MTVTRRSKSEQTEQINDELTFKRTRKKATSSLKEDKKIKEDQYFSNDTQQKIEDYKLSTCDEEKGKIYLNDILPAFEMLVDKLVSVYNFKSFDGDIDTMKRDCVFFLWETIQKWDGSKGKKAFSYFNVVAKNWLIARSRKNYMQFKRTVVIDDGNTNYTPNTQPKEEKGQQKKYPRINLSTYMIDESNNPEEQMIADERLQRVHDIIDHMCEVITDTRERKCVEAIRMLFQNIDNLEFLNKRALLVYLREISGLNNAELSSALSSVRKTYKQINKDIEESIFDLI